MLKLIWTPGTPCIPAEPDGDTVADVLHADDAQAGPGQMIRRADASLPALAAALAQRVDAWLRNRTAPDGPAYVLVHGFNYDPGQTLGSSDNPFSTIYAARDPNGPDPRLSLLPLVGECDANGHPVADVAVCFAWQSQGSFGDDANAGWDNDYKYAAFDLAPAAAKALAAVLAHLAKAGVPVRLLAHSLGTRTTSQAIGLLRHAGVRPTLERVVLLGGAEFSVDAAAIYADCRFDVISLGSRLDDVLVLPETVAHPVRVNNSFAAFVIGRCGVGGNPRWLDWQIDAPHVVAWMSEARAPTGAAYHVNARPENNVHPQSELGHWVYYNNDGNRALLRDLMTDPRMTVAALRAAGAPDGFDAPEWHHFAGMPVPPTPATRDGRAVHVARNTAHGRDEAAVA